MRLRRTFARFPWVGLLLALLVPGAVDFHAAEEAHDLLPSLGGGVYFPEAAHPDQPLHLERADPVQRPHCPACLLHLQVRGMDLRAAVRIAPPMGRTAVTRAADASAASASRRPSGARAPPSLS
ncbi:MAG TPA: hypothetical protein VE685_11105 [Thermoanaerobaculia bacterium]|nr:hypothetical protein [Thermoanaerobaculia bacterium]